MPWYVYVLMKYSVLVCSTDYIILSSPKKIKKHFNLKLITFFFFEITKINALFFFDVVVVLLLVFVVKK